MSVVSSNPFPYVLRARWVRLGELDLTSELDFTEHKDYRIDEHVVHPGYKGDEPYNDIALFHLDTDVTFTTFARPICLNANPSPDPISMMATGWGKTATGSCRRFIRDKKKYKDPGPRGGRCERVGIKKGTIIITGEGAGFGISNV